MGRVAARGGTAGSFAAGSFAAGSFGAALGVEHAWEAWCTRILEALESVLSVEQTRKYVYARGGARFVEMKTRDEKTRANGTNHTSPRGATGTTHVCRREARVRPWICADQGWPRQAHHCGFAAVQRAERVVKTTSYARLRAAANFCRVAA